MTLTLIPERWEKIIELVEEQGKATVEQIAVALAISPATVRRDLARIHQRGLIKRTRGGAEPSQQVRMGPTLAESRKINPVEKSVIGLEAAGLVGPGDKLMIDGGFTTYQAALNLNVPDLTVITNSLDVSHVIAGRENVRLVIIGGELSPESGTTVGPSIEQQISSLAADKAILGADAVSLEEGITSPILSTAQTKRTMIQCSREVIIAADYSKLGRSALYKVAPLESVTTLVTDDKADPEILDAFRASGIEVIIASNASNKEEPRNVF